MLWSLTKNVLIIINCKHVWSHPPVMDGIVIRKDIYPSVVRRDNWTQKFPEIFCPVVFYGFFSFQIVDLLNHYRGDRLENQFIHSSSSVKSPMPGNSVIKDQLNINKICKCRTFVFSLARNDDFLHWSYRFLNLEYNPWVWRVVRAG